MNIFDQLMEDSGLTAAGCWSDMDEYDREAIIRFGNLIVKECAEVALREDHEPSECILNHFGVKGEV
jgi:hypothetical protein